MADAKRAVYENLHFKRVFPDGFPDIGQGQFPCQHNPAVPKLPEQLPESGVVPAHLRAGMQGQRGHFPVDGCGAAQIGNDQTVRPQLGGFIRRMQKRAQLPVVDQCIQRQINADAVAVCGPDAFSQCLTCKILRMHPRMKGGAAQIDRVGTALNCRFQRLMGACRAE
ncbi:unknown [Clostridium sp. CAG:448]|nr:unknown [Clostridium sp. CAG:448]